MSAIIDAVGRWSWLITNPSCLFSSTHERSCLPRADPRLEKGKTAIADLPPHMRLAAAFRALLLGPGGWLDFAGFALPILLDLLSARRIGLVNRALRVDAALRVRSLAADGTEFTARLRDPGHRLLFAHPTTPPTTRANCSPIKRARLRSLNSHPRVPYRRLRHAWPSKRPI